MIYFFILSYTLCAACRCYFVEFKETSWSTKLSCNHEGIKIIHGRAIELHNISLQMTAE